MNHYSFIQAPQLWYNGNTLLIYTFMTVIRFCYLCIEIKYNIRIMLVIIGFWFSYSIDGFNLIQFQPYLYQQVTIMKQGIPILNIILLMWSVLLISKGWTVNHGQDLTWIQAHDLQLQRQTFKHGATGGGSLRLMYCKNIKKVGNELQNTFI